MTSRPRLASFALQVVFTALILAVIVVVGQVPYGDAGSLAQLRLALRTVEGRIEICRDRSAEELAELPVHMRQETVCEKFSPRYRLAVSLDGRPVIDETVSRAGVRADRPLSIDRMFEVPVGRSFLSASFSPVSDPELEVNDEVLEVVENLPSYVYQGSIELDAARVTVLVLDERQRSFRVVR